MIFLVSYAANQGSMALKKSAIYSAAPTFSWPHQRIAQLLAFLESTPVAPVSLVPILGASELETMLSPSSINSVLQKKDGLSLQVANLAIRDIGISQIEALALRLEQVTQKRGRFPLLILNLTPEMMTYKFEHYLLQYEDEATTLMLLGKISPWDLQTVTAERRLILSLKAVSGTSSPVSTQSNLPLFHRKIQGAFARIIEWLGKRAQGDAFEVPQGLWLLWGNPNLHRTEPWDVGRLGEFKWGLPDSRPDFLKALALYQSPASKDYFRTRFNSCCDIDHLQISDSMLSKFKSVIQSLKKTAHKVILTRLPYSPDETARTQAAQHSARSALEALAKTSGVEIVFMEDTYSLSSSDYIDPIHISPDSAHRVDSFYADVVSKSLQSKRETK